jgi:hypothetical protein
MARWFLALLFSAGASVALSAVPDADIAVTVRKDKETIFVDVDCPVRAPLPVIWEVLTDYDHMSGFISSLEYSGIEGRRDNILMVRQKGKATLGVFTFPFDNVREVEIVPLVEIRSHHVSGDLESSTFTTRVIELDGTPHILNIGRYVPKAWVPPLVGPALIGGETRRQFADIRAEILRRSARPAASLTSRQ